MEEIRSARSELAVAASGGNLLRRICRLLGKDSSEKTLSWIPPVIVISLLIALIVSTTLALTTNEKYPAAGSITNKSENGKPENEPLNAEKNDSSTKILLETQIIRVSNDFLRQVGLDVDSLKSSNSWTQHRVDDSSNPSMFVIDSQTKESLLKNVDESEGSSSISHIYLMALSGREATIKNISGSDSKSQELGRFIKIKPTISKDGQSTYLDCELLTRWSLSIDVDKSEIVEYKVNAENALLSDDRTLLILGGKPTSDIKGRENVIILIKTSIVPPEQSDDVDSKASSYKVAKIGGYKVNELLRIYLDLDLETGQYVEIKDSGQRESFLKQVDTSDIGKSGKDFPGYASYIDFEIRSNVDLNLATKRYTRGSFFEHDKWDAYFTGPDTIIGNGRFSTTTLCVSAWRVKLFPLATIDDDTSSLVAVIIKPSNEPQKPSAQFLLDKMLEHRSRVKNLQYVAESEIWRDPAAKKDLIEDQTKGMKEKGAPRPIIEGLKKSLDKAPYSHVQILKCTVDDAGHSKIELTIEDRENHTWSWNGVIEREYHEGNLTLRNKPNISITYGHPWRSFTGIFCQFLKETIEAQRLVGVEVLNDGTYRVAFDYRTSRYAAIIDP
jgi:hypothetical protein